MTQSGTKYLTRVTAVLFFVGITFASTAQSHSNNQGQKRFLVDPHKPYVYLEVDHVGPREPRTLGEPNIGIWLRLHNNCIVPITVHTFGVPDLAFAPPSSGPDEEIGVFDSVIANPPPWGLILVEPPKGGPLPGTLKPSELAKFLWASPQPQPVPTACAPAPTPKHEDAKMPRGYWFDVGTLTTIYPGDSIYFSLPRNHVSPKWHVEIQFEFDLNVHSTIPRPENYVTLYEDQIEERVQSQHSQKLH